MKEISCLYCHYGSDLNVHDFNEGHVYHFDVYANMGIFYKLQTTHPGINK